VRSLLGFGAGAVSPWVFGVVLDICRAHDASPAMTWGLAWSALGLGALLGPFLTWKLRRMPAARQMANGRR
jgi:MFS family permease